MAVTFFLVPKPFEGRMGTIQRNAVRSLQSCDASCQVLVCGNEPGCGEVVAEFGLDHIPDVARNEFGTPLVSSVFDLAEEHARYDLLCYVNADLILFPDFLDAVRRVKAACKDFLIVGQTTNVAVGESEGGVALEALRDRALDSGTVRPRTAIDFFAFQRGRIGTLPGFAVGRPSWDNWLIWHARSLRMAVVDITPSTLVLHQEHGHDHVPQSSGVRWEGPEADRNRQLLGYPKRSLTIDESTHRLTTTGLVRNTERGLVHRIGTELQLRPWVRHLYPGLRRAYLNARRRVVRNASPG